MIENYTEKQKKQFWAKVESGTLYDCWNWKGAKKPKGYGNVRINKKYLLAHRVAFEITIKQEIPNGLVVLHLCDNTSCCNPSHMALGTIKANTFDMIKKGRDGFRKNKASGACNGNSRLKETDIPVIREMIANGETQDNIAKVFCVAQTTISRIHLNQTWATGDTL